MEDKTVMIVEKANEPETHELKRPTVFVCQEKTITEYRLEGLQNMGRPESGVFPDIMVYGRFVSRNHGVFETGGDETVFHVLKTTNGLKYNGKTAEPFTDIRLRDGDELMIPSGNKDEGEDAVIVYASTQSRIRMWRNLQEASRDKLTGLCNREDFMIWWGRNYARRDYKDAVLFIMDVDDFKEVNDKKGHNAGDEVLKIVAEELTNIVRYQSQICRWGGDEFIGVVPGTPEKAESRLKNLSRSICERSAEAGIPVSVSIGYVDSHKMKDAKDMSGMIEFADKALYNIKKTGKGGVGGYGS